MHSFTRKLAVVTGAGADDRNATASVVRPRLADGCFSPTMRKPSRSRLEASAALLLLGGVGPDVRPGAIVPPWLSA